MDDFQHVGYSKEVIEFVAVAKEFCDFVEAAAGGGRELFLFQIAKIYSFDLFEGEFIASLRE